MTDRGKERRLLEIFGLIRTWVTGSNPEPDKKADIDELRSAGAP